MDYELSFGLEYVLGGVVRMAMSEAVNVYCRRAIESMVMIKFQVCWWGLILF